MSVDRSLWALDPHARGAWWRRSLMGVLTASTAGAGVWLGLRAFGDRGFDALEIAVLALFGVGLAWLSLSFWAAMVGLVLGALGLDPITLRRRALASGPVPRLRERTAIVMPIYNEDPQRIFGGVAAIYDSLRDTGQLEAFDFYVLSDTTQEPLVEREREAHAFTRFQLGAADQLFYRRRTPNAGRKAGNIGAWLKRRGRDYAHMLVLDADSVMNGDAIVRLAALMEASPRAGIIQTLAVCVDRETLFARVLQFSSRVYGGVLAAGHSFWWKGEGNYYGHNAIIRTSAFAEHADLPRLSGEAPLGGDILSHDFVEAAFVRRGGFNVWLLPQIEGSFEELPTNVLDYAARDRRWVQGNLQHARLLGEPGLHAMSRLHLGLGVLAYVASPLWLLLLVCSGAMVAAEALAGPSYFGDTRSLFPLWRDYRTLEVHALLALTATLLFAPKLLTVLLACARSRVARGFGGRLALAGSALLEIAFTTLLAPVMMLFHTGFIAQILAGRAVGWPAQAREESGVPWAVALRRHAGHVAAGLSAAAIFAVVAPHFLPWIAPVAAGLILAPAITVWSSSVASGRAARRACLFLIPEETAEPTELKMREQSTPALEGL